MSPADAPKRIRVWLAGLADWLRQNRLVRHMRTHPWLLVLMLNTFIAVLMTPHMTVSFDRYEAGNYARHAIKADRDFDLEDEASTAQRRDEAATAIPPVFDHDAQADQRQVKRLAEAFAYIRNQIGVTGNENEDGETGEMGKASLVSPAAFAEHENRFQQILGISLSDDTLAHLRKHRYAKSIENAVGELLHYALSRLVVIERKELTDQTEDLPGEKTILLRELNSKAERVYANLEQIWDIPTLREKTTERAKKKLTSTRRRGAVLDLALGMVGPTLDFNRAATEERRNEAREQVGPSIIHFKKNQLIVAEGEQITENHLLVLRAMQTGSGTFETLVKFAALVLGLTVVLMLLVNFAQYHIRKFNPAMRDYGFLLTTTALAALLMWLGKILSEPLVETYDYLTPEAIRYLFPVAGLAMLVRFLLYSEAALVWAVFASIVAGLMVEGSFPYGLFILAGSVAGAHAIGRAETNGRVMRAGFFVGLVGMAVALSVQVLADPRTLVSWTTVVNLAAALLGGMLTGPFMLSLVVPFEALFGYTSNLRLMELANLNHPLLGRMLVEAPGTYHHSLIVSALAEKGAEAIHANPLLAKVAGLYHDIGKINKPQYFIENQIEGRNPHDGLPPHMSGLILINHVREGVDLAKRYKLGLSLRRIIAEHHGRSRINFFYNRARQKAEATGKEKINEEDFRYRGPVPQSKESALVMLADVVEAATRSLKQPTPARIEATVNELLAGVYNDGQLDECEMTLKDLHRVAAQFTTILTGRYHGRIEYPEQEAQRRGKVVHIPAKANAPSEEGDDSPPANTDA